MRHAITVITGICLLAMAAVPAQAVDSASCQNKRSWQRSIVRAAIADWVRGTPDPDRLVELVQAEHGIVACAAGSGQPGALHTVTLPRGLSLDQLGAVLLANELEWRGLVAPPAAGLQGEVFRIKTRENPVREDY